MYRERYYSGMTATSAKRFGSGLDKQQREEAAKKEQELIGNLGQFVDLVELRVAKNRNGRIGNINLLFYTSYGRFDTPSDEFEKKLSEIRNVNNVSDIED